MVGGICFKGEKKGTHKTVKYDKQKKRIEEEVDPIRLASYNTQRVSMSVCVSVCVKVKTDTKKTIIDLLSSCRNYKKKKKK